jgi:hypothetical protein
MRLLVVAAVWGTAILPLGCASVRSDHRPLEAPAPVAVHTPSPAISSEPAGRIEGTTASPQQPAPPAQAEIDAAKAKTAARAFLFHRGLMAQPTEVSGHREVNGDWWFGLTVRWVEQPDGTYEGYYIDLAPLYLVISPNGGTGILTTVPNIRSPGAVNWCGLQDDPIAAAFIGRACSQSARISAYEFVAEQELGEKGWLFQIVECFHYPDETTPDCVQSVVLVNRQGECALVFTSPERDREHPHQGNFEPIGGRTMTP